VTYTVGIDIGQMADPTAVSVADLRTRNVRVLRLERLPLRQPYPEQVRRLVTLIRNLRAYAIREARITADRSRLINIYVDVTGVGRSPHDMLIEANTAANVRVYAVTLTAGQEATRDGYELHIPKLDLVDRLRRLMEEGRLEVPAGSAEARAVQTELRMFAGVKTSAASVSTGAREGAHDDLVIALALSAWEAAAPGHHRSFQGVRRGAFGNGPWREGGDPEPVVPVRKAYGGTVMSDDSFIPDAPVVVDG